MYHMTPLLCLNMLYKTLNSFAMILGKFKYCFRNSFIIIVATGSGERNSSKLKLVLKSKNYNDSRKFV